MEAIKSYQFDMVPKPTVKLLSPLIRARTLPEILSEKYSTRKLSPARKNPENAGKISGCRQKEIKDEIIYGLTILIHPPKASADDVLIRALPTSRFTYKTRSSNY